jgi:acyl carrier protein
MEASQLKKFTEEKVLSIIRSVIPNVENLDTSTKILQLHSDSIILFELLVTFEKELDHEIDYEDVVLLDTVGDIVDLAMKKFEKNPNFLSHFFLTKNYQ